MGRYLIFMSYIGTGFCGLQQQTGRPVKTVVSVLQKALARLQSANIPAVTTSSRTDKGVHALCNTVHVDLEPCDNGKEFDADDISAVLNESFMDFQEDIRVLKTMRVNNNFHSRYQARQRTYVYRICVAKQPHMKWAIPYLPFEYKRSLLMRQPLDVELVHKAASILRGIHDFKAFTTPSSLLYRSTLNNAYPTVRFVDIEVAPSTGFLSNYASASPIVNQFDYWDLVFRSRSFLYKQVRKMTGVLLAAGCRDISLDDVRKLVDNPDQGSLCKTNVYDIPPYGLYMANIEYDPKDLIFNPLVMTESLETQKAMECDSEDVNHNFRNHAECNFRTECHSESGNNPISELSNSTQVSCHS
jgi:tRNA pseudouridine(38-40) synthase